MSTTSSNSASPEQGHDNKLASTRVLHTAELLDMILAHLTPKQALGTQRVCKAFSKAINKNSALVKRVFIIPPVFGPEEEFPYLYRRRAQHNWEERDWNASEGGRQKGDDIAELQCFIISGRVYNRPFLSIETNQDDSRYTTFPNAVLETIQTDALKTCSLYLRLKTRDVPFLPAGRRETDLSISVELVQPYTFLNERTAGKWVGIIEDLAENTPTCKEWEKWWRAEKDGQVRSLRLNREGCEKGLRKFLGGAIGYEYSR